MAEQKKQIIIGGCPRSGTSLFADLLKQCGLKTVTDLRNSDQYPRGYYEYFPLLMFHKAMERYPRGALHRITAEPFLQPEMLTDDFTRQIYELAFEPFGNNEIDFIKYPQLALSTDFLLTKYPDLHFILLWRNPAAVFKSLIQKEFPVEMRPASAIKAILLQSVYGYHIRKAVQAYPRRVSVFSIDTLIDQQVDLAPGLKEMGYEIEGEWTLARSMDPNIWTRKVPFYWYLYYHFMRMTVLLLAPWLSPQQRKFIHLRQINKEIYSICYGPNTNHN